MNAAALAPQDALRVRAVANKWISENFPERRKFLSHTVPITLRDDGAWLVGLLAWHGKTSTELATLAVQRERATLVTSTPEDIAARIDTIKASGTTTASRLPVVGQFHDFRYGDGIEGIAAMSDKSVDLLLTDPPYGISNPYVCEKQVPRRLRKDGRDFIMPRGHFGDWDKGFPEPAEWTQYALPKVAGWAVVFCAQAQIGEYLDILKGHKFVAVGPMVWQKTNPVPFNHTKKPINAWEAIVVGKRPGTNFNGRVVHNVFTYKSPSPQRRFHPTQKPLDLISEFVRLFSTEGDLVVDPFAGAATTVLGAAMQSRRVVAFENDGDVFDAAASRIADAGLLS